MSIIKKNKNKKLPAIIGILLLVVGVGAGIFLVQSDTGFIPRATPEFAPQSLVVTNISENSFSISWVTDQKAGGFLKYGVVVNKLNTVENDDRDQLTGNTGSYNTHHITIKNLEPETTYYFKIASGGKNQFYNDNGQPYQVITAPVLGNISFIMSSVAGFIVKSTDSVLNNSAPRYTLETNEYLPYNEKN